MRLPVGYDVAQPLELPTRFDRDVWRLYVRAPGRLTVLRISCEFLLTRATTDIPIVLAHRPSIIDLLIGGAQTIEVDVSGRARAI